jgi:hypothetical protein
MVVVFVVVIVYCDGLGLGLWFVIVVVCVCCDFWSLFVDGACLNAVLCVAVVVSLAMIVVVFDIC